MSWPYQQVGLQIRCLFLMSKCKKGCMSVCAHEKIKRLRETWSGLLLLERRKTSQLCHLGEARTWPCSFRYAEKMEGMILKILTLVEKYYLREAELNFKASTSLLGRCLQLPVPVPFSKTILSVEEKRFSWALQEIYFSSHEECSFKEYPALTSRLQRKLIVIWAFKQLFGAMKEYHQADPGIKAVCSSRNLNLVAEPQGTITDVLFLFFAS